MNDFEETNRLIAEIRDILAGREQVYKEHLEASDKLYTNRTNEWRRQARQWTIIQWAGIALLVYGAVLLAMSQAK